MGESVWEISRIFLKYIREGATKGWVKKKKQPKQKTNKQTKQRKNIQKQPHQTKNSWFGLVGLFVLIKKLSIISGLRGKDGGEVSKQTQRHH